MKSYQNHNKDLKVKHIMYILKKITRLDQAAMMIRDSKLLIKLHHIHTMQTLEKYARISKYKIIILMTLLMRMKHGIIHYD